MIDVIISIVVGVIGFLICVRSGVLLTFMCESFIPLSDKLIVWGTLGIGGAMIMYSVKTLY